MAIEQGANGTMVAAVLESIGYYYHQVVLEDLTPAFKGSLGGFVYMIGVVLAVFGVAIRGGYKFGPWLLIGPPLFFAAVLPTKTIKNAEWKYAKEGRNQEWVDLQVSRSLKVGSGSYKVSSLFHYYNNLISKSVQEIAALINKQKDTDRTFIVKGQLLGELLHMQVQNPGLDQMISHNLFGYDCARLVNAAMTINDPRMSEGAKSEARKELRKNFDHRKFHLTKEGARAVAIARGAAGAEIDKLTQEVMREPWSCKLLWDEVKKLLYRDAEDGVMTILKRAEMNGMTFSGIARKLSLGLGNFAVNNQAAEIRYLVNAAMKRALMLKQDRRSLSGMIDAKASAGNDVGEMNIINEPSLSETEYARGRSTEWSEKTRMMTAAGNLPYYQGLLLFFLAVAYPFFAMLLLVPGKHAGFLLWFVLWLWVKSWDIGMAVVMQIDDIMFAIFSRTRELYPTGPQSHEFEQQFDKMMWILKNADPTFQMSTYYNIIACCLMAIPVISSQFILGSLTGGAGIVAQGMRFSTGAFADNTRAAQGQYAVSSLRQEMLQMAADRAQMKYEQMKSHSGPGIFTKLESMMNASRFEADRGLPHRGSGSLSGAADYGKLQGDQYNQPSGKVNIRQSLQTIETLQKWVGRVEAYTGDRAGFGIMGYSDPVRNGKDTPAGVGVLQDVIKEGGKIVNKVLLKMSDAEQERMNKGMDAQGAWVLFDTVYSNEGRRLAAEARMYGSLEVPWTETTGEFKEMEFERAMWNKYMELNATYAEAMMGSVQLGAKSISGLFHSKEMQEMAERERSRLSRGVRP